MGHLGTLLYNPPLISSLTVLPQASWVAPKGPRSVPQKMWPASDMLAHWERKHFTHTKTPQGQPELVFHSSGNRMCCLT